MPASNKVTITATGPGGSASATVTLINPNAQQISPAMKALAREGQREYRERMSPYLRRMYTDIFANQVWVGDTAILDVEAANDLYPELPDHAPLVFHGSRFRQLAAV